MPLIHATPLIPHEHVQINESCHNAMAYLIDYMFRGSCFSPFQKQNKKGVTGAWQRMRTIVKVELQDGHAPVALCG